MRIQQHGRKTFNAKVHTINQVGAKGAYSFFPKNYKILLGFKYIGVVTSTTHIIRIKS